MGTITKRKRSNGSFGYTAQIRIDRGGEKHTEAKTFDRRQAAAAWIAKREAELSKEGAIEKAKVPRVTLAEAIDKYIGSSLKEIGRTKAQVLRTIKGYDIAAKDCAAITSADLVAFATKLGGERQPQTVRNYLSNLSSVFAIARPAWGYPLDAQAMTDAQKVLKRLGGIAGSAKRSRRPTMAELDTLMQFYSDRAKTMPDAAPMDRIVAFALFSTRRQEEITRIAWADLDTEHSRILVRDMKNPGQKIGNDVWCELPPEALAIIEAMPKVAKEIFPYDGRSVSASFTRVTKLLGIEDLHFHDLRHEGVSRLFEMGRTVPLAASVSGHRAWSSLQRYTHIKAVGDRYEGWKWLPIVTAPMEPPKKRRGKPRA